MEKVKIDVTASGGELIIREGEAPDVRLVQGYNISGCIKSPRSFYETQFYDFKNAYLTADYKNSTLTLVVNPDIGEETIFVYGRLHEDDVLKTFKINGGYKHEARNLSDLFKRNRSLFVDSAVNRQLVSSLKNLKLKVEQHIDKEEHDNGNHRYLDELNINIDMPLEFTMVWPIFKNGEKKTFSVNMVLSVTPGKLWVQLESIELLEMMRDEAKKVIDEEVAKMSNLAVFYV